MSYTIHSLENLKLKAVADFRSTRRALDRLRKLKSQKLDKLINELHIAEFEKINCLECANCCKSISPAIYSSDIRRMASALKMRTSAFIDEYLVTDEEGDFVLKQTPCPFLGANNYCVLYDSRPKACRNYPHTNRKRFHQILDLTASNSKVCPAVFNIIRKLESK